MKFIDISGKRFGKLIAMEVFHKSTTRHGVQWQCLCDCGKKTIVYGVHLRNGTTKSCGCNHYPRKSNHPGWKGFGEISGYRYAVIKKNAREKRLQFTIDIQYLWRLFCKQNKKCNLSGELLTFDSDRYLHNGTASLDRIDSSIGYVKGNVQWVHKEINIMKNKHSTEHFLNLCRKITKYARNKKTI